MPMPQRQTYAFPEAEVGAHKCQRHRHTEPQRQQSDQRAEWHGARAALAPQHQVHHEEQAKHNAAKRSHKF